MKVPIHFGGGSGDGSDDCTATAADILESKTAIYNGSNDEPDYGSMKDYSGTTQSATASLDSSNNRVQLPIPNTGKYDTAAKLYTNYANMANLIGLTADKLVAGQNVLGIEGTYKPSTVYSVNQYMVGAFDFGSSNAKETTYTCTADGLCYYSGISAASSYQVETAANITCKISLNGSVIADLSNNPSISSTQPYVEMHDEGSFAVSAGDVITLEVNAVYYGAFVVGYIAVQIIV